MDALRTRAGAPTVADAQPTVDFQLDRRDRELLSEGHRRTQLIRCGA